MGRVKIEQHMPASHSLYIDCMQFMPHFPDKFFSIGVPDPPYGLGESSKNHKSRNTPIVQRNGNILHTKQPDYGKSDWDKSIPTPEYFAELFRVTVNQIIFGANYFPYICGVAFKAPRRHEYDQFLQDHPTNWIIWDKVNGDSDFSDCELIWVSFPVPSRIIYFMWSGMLQGISMQHGTTMQGNKKLNEKRVHPTQKPLPVYQWLYQTFARPGDIMLDTHMGAQGSRIAAYKMGYDYYGTEISQKHYDDGCARFRAACYEPLFFNQ